MTEEIYFEAPVSFIQRLYSSDEKILVGLINDILSHAAALTGLSLEKVQEKLCFNTTNQNMIKEGRELMEKHSGEAMFKFKRSRYWEFHRHYADFSDEDRLLLAAYLALTSILGNKRYCKLTNELWLSRMSGNTTVEMKQVPDKQEKRIRKMHRKVDDDSGTKKKKKTIIVEEEFTATLSYKKVPSYLEEVDAINTRRKLQSLKERLYDEYGIAFYGLHTRGFYVSEKLTLEELIAEVESKKERQKIESALQRDTRLALEKIMERKSD